VNRARGPSQSKRAALRALERAKRTAEASGTDLSDWEGEFLGSVEARIETFGRAFADPTKGAAGESLSALQQVKLKEITRKAKGAATAPRKSLTAKRGFGRGAARRSEG
jgi:hypothetical protein